MWIGGQTRGDDGVNRWLGKKQTKRRDGAKSTLPGRAQAQGAPAWRRHRLRSGGMGGRRAGVATNALQLGLAHLAAGFASHG